MSDDAPKVQPEDDPKLAATRKLLASVEELRALLAPLTPGQREEVLELARRLKDPHHHE